MVLSWLNVATEFPSGEKAGKLEWPGPETSGVTFLVSRSSWKRSSVPERSDWKTTRQPSGEKTASVSLPGPVVNGRGEAMAGGFGMSPEDLQRYPPALIGSVDEICETLHRRREQYGISYITVTAAVMEAFAPVVARLGGT